MSRVSRFRDRRTESKKIHDLLKSDDFELV